MDRDSRPICSAGVREMEAPTSPLHQEPSASTCDALAGDACTDDGALTGSSDPETSSPFCIRGYVAAVREIDIKRCWPFSLCLLEKSIQAGKDPLLPPLTPFECAVTVQREYFDGADSGATCDVSSGPQLQVQIDVSKCENESPIAETAEESPVEGEHTLSSSTHVACSPHRVLTQMHCSPYVEKGLNLKRETPRSIEEIRRSIMQGCECSRCMGTGLCEKQSCSKPDIKYVSHKERTDAGTEGNSTESLNDGIDSQQKEKVTTCENVSAIMNFEESIRALDTGGDVIKNAISDVDDRPTLINRTHDDAREAGDELLRSCNLSHESGKSSWGHELPPLANMEPRPSTDCRLEYRGLSKSIESHNSKSLEIQPNESDVVSIQQEELETVSGPDATPQQRCPVCGDFQCSSNTALNAHMDGCLAMTSGGLADKLKIKSQRGKVRKKRSIAELCQMALPPESTNGLPSPGSSKTPHNGKEIISTDLLERKRTKLHPGVIENTTTLPSKSDRSKKQDKSQDQALQVFRWRSKSASTSHNTQSLQGSKRGMVPEASLAHFNKSKLRSRKLEMKGSRALRKNQWKRGKIIREPSPFHKSPRHGTQQSQKGILNERKKGKRVLQNNVNCLQKALLQSGTPTQSNEFENSAPNVEGQEVCNLAPPRKRKHPDPTAHMRTSETVVTVKGSHETTFEFLRADEAAVEELNEPRKVHFLVHVKPRKKRSKQKTTVRMPQNKHHTETIFSDATENPKYVCSHIKANHIERALPGEGQTSLVKNKSRNFDNSRRLAQKNLTPETQLPLLSHARLNQQAQESLPPVEVISSLHQGLLEEGEHPSMATAGRSTTKDASKCFTETDGRPLFSHNLHTKSLQNHSDGCTGLSLASLLNESPPSQCTNSQKAQAPSTLASMLPQCRGAKVQRRRQFPFSLSADELSRWPQNKTSSRAAYQFRPEQIAKLAQILGVSNRNRGFLAGKQTLRPGTKFSFQPKLSQMTPQLNQAPQVNTKQLLNIGGSELNASQAHSDHQRLPAWMQAAIHEQRPSAMPSMEMLTSPVGHLTLNTTSSTSRDMSNPSSTFNVIRNPVLRLMGKTMVLLPEASQDQVDLNSSHPPSSSKYINFLHTLDSEEQPQHWNEDRVCDSVGREDIASQDFGCNNGVESWVGSSPPHLQDFFLQMSASSPKRNSPMPDQTTSYWAKGITMPEQEENSRWLQLESSPVSLRLLHTENTNWQSQKRSTQPLFQPQSTSLRCDCAERVTRHPLCESDVWPRQHKYLASCGTREATNDLLCLGSNRTRTPEAPILPCWHSHDDIADQRGDQRGTLTVVDEEGPLCSFDRSTPGPSKDLMLSSGQNNQRPQPNTKTQSRAQNSAVSKSRKDKQKSKTFIPIIYTVGGNSGFSHHAPGIAGDRLHQKVAEETELRDTAQVGEALTSLRRKISCLDQPGMQTRITTHEDGRDPPEHVTKVGAKSHNISEACQFDCDLTPMPSMEAIRAAARRMKSLPTRTRNSLCRTLLSRKLSVPVPQEITTAKAPPSLELETPRLEMCSVNMNPAEVDCHDAGQFMSTPKFISSFRGSTTIDAGQKCVHTSQAMKAPLQPQNLNSAQTDLRANTIHNAALPAPSSPKLPSETDIRRRVMLESPCAKALQKDVHNSLTSLNISKAPAALEKASTKGTVTMPFNAANFLAVNCSNGTGMHQECNSRLHALKAAGKFRISNGRVLMVRKEVPVDMANAAAIGKCLQGQ